MSRSGPRYATLVALTTAALSWSVLQSMIVPALPTLERSLHTSTAWVTWVLTVFLVVSAVAAPILGKLGDQYGKRRVLVWCLAAFFIGSLGATLAWDVGSLIAFRAIQGVGGGIFPLSFAITRDIYPAERSGVGIGVVSSAYGIGSVLGIVLAGPIVDHVSWRLMFGLSTALLAAAVALVVRYVPESPIRARTRLDVWGAALLAGGLVCFLLGLTEGSALGWHASLVLGYLVGAVLLLGLWVRVEARVAEPMVDLEMLRVGRVLLVNAATLCSGFAIFGMSVLTSNFVQVVPGAAGTAADFGFSASLTGAALVFLPTAILIPLTTPLVGAVRGTRGLCALAALGLACTAASGFVIAAWHDQWWQVIGATMFLGPGIGLAFAAIPKLVMDAVEPTESGIAAGLNIVIRMVGGVIGAQVAAVFIASETVAPSGHLAEAGFTHAYLVCGAVSLIGVACAAASVRAAPRRGRVRAAGQECFVGARGGED